MSKGSVFLTTCTSLSWNGKGLRSGREVRLTLDPAESTEAHFGLRVRWGRQGDIFPLVACKVVSRFGRSYLISPQGKRLDMAGPFFGALGLTGVNCGLITVEGGEEAPYLDSSAQPYVERIGWVGTLAVALGGPYLKREVELYHRGRHGGGFDLRPVEAGEAATWRYELDLSDRRGWRMLPSQQVVQAWDDMLHSVAKARRFGLAWQAGLAEIFRRDKLDRRETDLLHYLGAAGLVEPSLRHYADEEARRMLLELVAELVMRAGYVPANVHVRVKRGGPQLHTRLAKAVAWHTRVPTHKKLVDSLRLASAVSEMA